MRTIYVSPEFPLNRRMRKDVRRGKMQVVRESGERSSLGGGIPSGKRQARRDFRVTKSPLVCMADNGAEIDQLGGGGTQMWAVLENPGDGHPDVDILREVDNTLASAKRAHALPDLNPYFVRQLNRYETALCDGADLLREIRHTVAFIGNIGVGKTSMICGLTGLTVRNKEGHDVPALKVGMGRTTICEVCIERGHRENQYELRAQPRDDEEVKKDIADWCEYQIRVALADNTQVEGEKIGVSGELDRAIRNMSNLAVRRDRKPDGSQERVDLAKNLAAEIGNVDKFRSEVLKRINLSQRTLRKIEGDSPEWLRKNFADINDGRNPVFSIPERMTVVVPHHLLGEKEKQSGLEISILDTKGVDEIAFRGDLAQHFDDPHTIIALCSGFVDAPDLAAQQHLERARESGVGRSIAEKTSILVLPKGNEAMRGGGDHQSVEDAYEDKSDQIKAAIYPLGVGEIPDIFYNAEQDKKAVADKVRAFFVDRAKMLRGHHRERLRKLNETVNNFLKNREEAAFLVQQEAAAQRLTNRIVGQDIDAPDSKIQDELIVEMHGVRHAGYLRASVARMGLWHNFNYYDILGFGARKIAHARIKGWLHDFKVTTDDILSEEGLSKAHGFVREIWEWLDGTDGAREKLLKGVEQECAAAFKISLQGENAQHRLWGPSREEWGKGPGYKNRVAMCNHTWFDREVATEVARHIESQFINGWRDIMKELRDRLSVESPPPQ